MPSRDECIARAGRALALAHERILTERLNTDDAVQPANELPSAA